MQNTHYTHVYVRACVYSVTLKIFLHIQNINIQIYDYFLHELNLSYTSV